MSNNKKPDKLPGKLKVCMKIEHLPHPKPRMTRRDAWAISKFKKGLKSNDPLRGPVKKYLDWKACVEEAWFKTRGRRMFDKCRIEFMFFITGHPKSDLDNYIKAVKDALNGLAFKDDNISTIPEYGPAPPKAVLLCEHCGKQKKKGGDCGKVRDCKLGYAVVKIEEI